ncbi:MAG: hypothetical protein M9890_09775 [Thermomicrobiales bacterium]|nr:hypothetical protein [Thermomicrobiales bacterium]
MEEGTRGVADGCVLIGAGVALIMLVLGVAVPLAGGTDFNGLPRTLGLSAITTVWVIVVVAALRRRQWLWLGVVVALGPLPVVAYSAFVADSLSNPEAWDAFSSAPWELLVLLLTPMPLFLYGLLRQR